VFFVTTKYPSNIHLNLGHATPDLIYKNDTRSSDNIEGKGQEDFEGLVIQYGSESYLSWFRILNFLNLR